MGLLGSKNSKRAELAANSIIRTCQHRYRTNESELPTVSVFVNECAIDASDDC